MALCLSSSALGFRSLKGSHDARLRLSSRSVSKHNLKNFNTMAHSWIVLSTTWRLEDVQAGLNVIITLVSAFAIIVFARLSWRKGVQRVYKQRSVPIFQFTNLTTLGDVQDVVRMLKSQVLSRRYLRILFQCVVVVFPTATATLAGPISRYSTRRGQIPKKSDVGGLLATTTNACQYYATAAIDDTMAKLDKASFPTDELLDFLPDSDQDWVYVPSEWNSTFSANCAYTDSTPINLTATGKFTYDNLGQTEIFNEIPRLWDIFSPKFTTDWFSLDWDLAGQTNDTEMLWKEAVLFLAATIQPDGEMNLTTSMSLAIAVVHLQDAPEANFTDDRSGSFAPGVIPKSSYKKVECEIRPTAAHPVVHKTYEDFYWRAFPDVFVEADPSCFTTQLASNYLLTAIRPSVSGEGYQVNTPSAEDMFRFYQAYLITKDTYYANPTTRTISIQRPTVDISAIFVAFMSLLILIISIGTFKYVFFLLQNSGRLRMVPQTKLGWLMQSIQEAAYFENLGSPRLTADARFTNTTYSVVPEGSVASASSGIIGKVHGMSSDASAVQTRTETDASKAAEFKLGFFPFETRLV